MGEATFLWLLTNISKSVRPQPTGASRQGYNKFLTWSMNQTELTKSYQTY